MSQQLNSVWSSPKTNLSSSKIETWLYRSAKGLSSGQSLNALKKTIRWADWALSKIPAICLAGAYLCLAHGKYSQTALANVFVFTYVFAVANGAFGYLINDLGDRAIDRAHGKTNVFNALGTQRGFICIAMSLFAMLCASMPFIKQPGFIPVWLISVSLSVSYSLAPARLKERGVFGLLSAAVAMCGLPIVLMSIALGFGCGYETILLALLCTINGATLEVGHQRFDRTSDQETGTLTWAARVTERALNRAYWHALWLDRAAVGVLIWIILLACIKTYALIVALPVVLAYFVSMKLTITRLRAGEIIDPYFGTRLMEDRLIHNVIPNFLLPLCALTALCSFSPAWICLLLWFIAWRFALYL